MPENTETMRPDEVTAIERISRWFDMIDEALEIGTHRKS